VGGDIAADGISGNGEREMKEEETLIHEMAQSVGDQAMWKYMADLDDLFKRTESPIERVLLAAMVKVNNDSAIGFLSGECGILGPEELEQEVELSDSYVGGVYPQVKIGNYRVDLFFEAGDREKRVRWFRAAIECDGHDFHERTKEQAAQDKSRDRWLQQQAIMVLRFIWAQPEICAHQVFAAFNAARLRFYRLVKELAA
jgi:very-short-patch-repair endonuclease